jgi:hypothetical protein
VEEIRFSESRRCMEMTAQCDHNRVGHRITHETVGRFKEERQQTWSTVVIVFVTLHSARYRPRVTNIATVSIFSTPL